MPRTQTVTYTKTVHDYSEFRACVIACHKRSMHDYLSSKEGSEVEDMIDQVTVHAENLLRAIDALIAHDMKEDK